MTKIKTAIFPVGGLGTRFLPATKSMPKEMLTIVDKPLIQYAFEEARAAGVENFIFITGRNKNIISNHFDHAYELQKVLDEKEKKHLLALTKDWLPAAGNIAFIRQQEPLGLGHAIYCARNFIKNEPFAVLLADDVLLSKKPVLGQMVEAYEENGAGNYVAIEQVARDKTSSYGIIDAQNTDQNIVEVKDMVEKPAPENAPSDLGIIGRYILQPEVFGYLEGAQKGSGGEIQITDSIAQMIGSCPTYGVKFEGERFDCGGRLGFVKANIAFALEKPDMRDGVLEMIKEFV